MPFFVFISISHGFRPHTSVSFSAHEEIRVTDNAFQAYHYNIMWLFSFLLKEGEKSLWCYNISEFDVNLFFFF